MRVFLRLCKITHQAPAALLLLGGCLACGTALHDMAGPPDSAIARDATIPLPVPLPHTDGADLATSRTAPTPLERQQQRAVQRACEGPCITPFGTRLGVADGVEARLNCVSTCLRLEYSFVDQDSCQIRVAQQSPNPQRFAYAGVTYQCVEYARRWWIRNRGLTFGDVPTAADIFVLTQGLRLPGNDPVPLGRSLNGAAKRAHARGDLVVYAPDPEIRNGASGMSRWSWRWRPSRAGSGWAKRTTTTIRGAIPRLMLAVSICSPWTGATPWSM